MEALFGTGPTEGTFVCCVVFKMHPPPRSPRARCCCCLFSQVVQRDPLEKLPPLYAPPGGAPASPLRCFVHGHDLVPRVLATPPKDPATLSGQEQLQLRRIEQYSPRFRELVRGDGSTYLPLGDHYFYHPTLGLAEAPLRQPFVDLAASPAAPALLRRLALSWSVLPLAPQLHHPRTAYAAAARRSADLPEPSALAPNAPLPPPPPPPTTTADAAAAAAAPPPHLVARGGALGASFNDDSSLSEVWTLVIFAASLWLLLKCGCICSSCFLACDVAQPSLVCSARCLQQGSAAGSAGNDGAALVRGAAALAPPPPPALGLRGAASGRSFHEGASFREVGFQGRRTLHTKTQACLLAPLCVSFEVLVHALAVEGRLPPPPWSLCHRRPRARGLDRAGSAPFWRLQSFRRTRKGCGRKGTRKWTTWLTPTTETSPPLGLKSPRFAASGATWPRPHENGQSSSSVPCIPRAPQRAPASRNKAGRDKGGCALF